MDTLEHSKFLISRFDHYYDSINNKGNAILALATFSIGGVATFYSSFHEDVTWTITLKILSSAMSFMWLISLIFTSLALMPFDRSSSKSLIFFGTIANDGEVNYIKRLLEVDSETLCLDYHKQVYCLAVGLNRKFKLMKYASFAMFISYGLLLFTTFTLLANLK